MALLELDNITVQYKTENGSVRAVNDVSLEIGEQERVGLVGESGCGKTTIIRSILQLLPENGTVSSGKILFEEQDLVTTDQSNLNTIRWNEIAIISQSAMNALNPVYTLESQLKEAMEIHTNLSEEEMSTKAEELFVQVGLSVERLQSYPHQLSGGMRQRAMIAMAMALEPKVILADEPTTALDVITQDHILGQIEKTTEAIGSSLLMITHDISVVGETCDKVAVMYAGDIVEYGPVEDVFTHPEHPYTQGLLHASPTITDENSTLITIHGEPPDVEGEIEGCTFYDRCPYSEPHCQSERPQLSPRKGSPKHQAACFVTENENVIEQEFSTILEVTEKWESL